MSSEVGANLAETVVKKTANPLAARSREDMPPRTRKSHDLAAATQLHRPTKRTMPLLLGLGGGFAALLLLAIAAFVWPAFLRTGSRPGDPSGGADGPDDILAYVPADSMVLAGANVAAMRTLPDFAQDIERFKTLSGMSLEMSDILEDVDKVVAAATGQTDKEGVIVFATRNSYDRDKVKKAFKAGNPTTVAGKTVYPLDSEPALSYLAMPHKRYFLVTNLSQGDLGKILTASQVGLPRDIMQQAEQINPATMWMLTVNRGQVNDGLKELRPNEVRKILPGGEKVIPYLQKAKTGFVTLHLGQTSQLLLGLNCAQDTDARAVAAHLNDLWFQKGKGLLAVVRGLVGLQKGMAPVNALLNDFTNSFKVEQDGPQVRASVQVAEKTLQDLKLLAEQTPQLPSKKKPRP